MPQNSSHWWLKQCSTKDWATVKAARQFGVVRSRIRAWERTYLEEGAAGFQEDRRGGESKAKTFPGYSPYQRSTALLLPSETDQPWRQVRGRQGRDYSNLPWKQRTAWISLHHRKYSLNHKTVQRLMKELGLVCRVRMKKYRCYKSVEPGFPCRTAKTTVASRQS